MLDYNSDFCSQIEPLSVLASTHTMGSSLIRYLALKVHPVIRDLGISSVNVMPLYDRVTGISPEEKPRKLFNFIRPTAIRRDESSVELRCFPGKDYLFHFGNVVASYVSNTNRFVAVRCVVPGVIKCWEAIRETGIADIPSGRVAIMGYVEGLDGMSPDSKWSGLGGFRWKRFCHSVPECYLIGCRHTYWGEIAGRVVTLLAEKGYQYVIYSGKLGSLDDDDEPNRILATSSCSILPDGRQVEWENLFEGNASSALRGGGHVTVPSVLQETVGWRESVRSTARFVDPEIGHMALAAQEANIAFSILHIVSDNLSRKFAHDLSNERLEKVRSSRRTLYTEIRRVISATLSRI